LTDPCVLSYAGQSDLRKAMAWSEIPVCLIKYTRLAMIQTGVVIVFLYHNEGTQQRVIEDLVVVSTSTQP